MVLQISIAIFRRLLSSSTMIALFIPKIIKHGLHVWLVVPCSVLCYGDTTLAHPSPSTTVHSLHNVTRNGNYVFLHTNVCPKVAYFVVQYSSIWMVIAKIWWLKENFQIEQGSLQIFSTMHEKMQISLKWLKYRLKIIISSFKYYIHTVTMVSKLKKYKKIHQDKN